MVKVNRLEIENVKRVKAVQIEPSANGLTVIGGKNGQGKTSVLDAIAWALGGNKYKPTKPERDGSVSPPDIRIELSNGLIVERKGKSSTLKVIDPNGNKAGQQLLDSFISELALNLPKFMQANTKEKANTLLQVIGVGDELYRLETELAQLYNKRRAIGQIADQKKKYADEMQVYPDVPDVPVSAAELIRQQQEILARNGENMRKRQELEALKAKAGQQEEAVKRISEQINELKAKLVDAGNTYMQTLEDIDTASKTVEQLQDESTAEIEASINNIEDINVKVRANLDKEKADQDAAEFMAQYDALTNNIEALRRERIELLNGADLPLPGLSVEDGALTYNGYAWDNMSGSEQLKVATAIIRKLNPDCGFVLIDKLEQMDLDTLQDFGKWLESEGLQAIATRVSTGDECSIIIEDGYSVTEVNTKTPATSARKWEAGRY
jgi:DNA repair exonuclease SbcCD ATPase subunit